MPDIINLLPDNIANQIAAGEVIQRPASAVKELLENAVDAGATHIQLIVAEAGKRLVQVIDNGKGMSETDARMSFERHATSKISQIDDLFHIKTMGFRGEALASIAAVARVELKTRRAEDSLGSSLEIENSEVLIQEPCNSPIGTSISMKNLFFNVPARRNFLKSNNAELRHINDEFIRVALAFPEIKFDCWHNDTHTFHLEAGSHKQRFVQLLGNTYNAKLVSIREQTDYMDIYGFVGKPEAARKTRSEQYFFVNNRFIRSAYLSHAVSAAFENLLPKDSYPIYALYVELDPAQIDINVHPTKQEIKFEDEKIIYSFIKAAVRHALAQYSVAPSLDFSLNVGIQQSNAISQPITESKKEATKSGSLYQDFTQKNVAHKINPTEGAELKQWKSFYERPLQEATTIKDSDTIESRPSLYATASTKTLEPEAQLLQIQLTYIAAPYGSGYLLVHQQHAHERIIYEKLSKATQAYPIATRQSLFPITIECSMPDAALMQDLLPELEYLGYKIEPFGGNSFIVQGTPADIPAGNEKNSIELLLEQYKHFSTTLQFEPREKLLRCLARQQAIKAGQKLSITEMHQLINDLFACQTPGSSPSGLPAFITYNEEDLMDLFGK